jgi:hypothetical protein
MYEQMHEMQANLMYQTLVEILTAAFLGTQPLPGSATPGWGRSSYFLLTEIAAVNARHHPAPIPKLTTE